MLAHQVLMCNKETLIHRIPSHDNKGTCIDNHLIILISSHSHHKSGKHPFGLNVNPIAWTSQFQWILPGLEYTDRVWARLCLYVWLRFRKKLQKNKNQFLLCVDYYWFIANWNPISDFKTLSRPAKSTLIPFCKASRPIHALTPLIQGYRLFLPLFRVNYVSQDRPRKRLKMASDAIVQHYAWPWASCMGTATINQSTQSHENQ